MNQKVRLVLVLVAVVTVAGVVFWRLQGSGPQTQAEAIAQAKAYKPEGGCTSSMTPAIHTATGAHYTFPSGCLAPGWEYAR